MSSNRMHPTSDVTVGGQPSLNDLTDAKEAGLRAVLNLRPKSEQPDFDERIAVERLGMQYLTIPVANANDLTRAAVHQLDEMLKDSGNRPIWIHCGTGNRVGALFALRAAWIEGKPVEDAIEIGRQHGLTKMEADVRQILI